MSEPRPGWWDFQIRTRTGQNLDTYWANVRLSDGSIIGIGIDITDRKIAEERLKTYMDQLQKSNKDLEEFAFIASHDLQEPLRKIRTFGDLLTSKLGDSINETGKDYVERMQKASLRMQKLIESLLTYSRVSTKTTKFSLVNLNEAIKEATNNLEIRIKESGASVESGDLPTIEADISQMTQLFQNLIGNALKFSRDNIPPIIRIYAQSEENPVNSNFHTHRIYVEDNGIGFEEKYLDRIFTPFQRIHGRGLYEGVGMGLAICNRIVRRHDGSITAKSEMGKGSTFIITLPMKHLEEDHAQPL
jgi:light-regulated signal transduction histidine kinase (bacteriophytochrome)